MTQINSNDLSIVEVKALLLDEIDKMEVSNRNAQQLRTVLNQKIQQADSPEKKEETKPPIEGEKK